MGANMLNFAWPWMLVLLPLPWIISKLRRAHNANNNKTWVLAFPKLKQLQSAYAGSRAWTPKLDWLTILHYVVWVCLVFSLMRPELVNDLSYSSNSGYDLILAVDLSRSMDTVDFLDKHKLTSRISAAKKVVANFVRQRSGDRVGLIVFADKAYLTIPLTLDTASVEKMLNNLIIGMAGESTAIGDAIGIGVQNLRKRPLSSRVLILLTDGVDMSSSIPPLEAAKIAAADKIKIYTIGVGNNMDDKLLQEIADMTGGTYAAATSVNALEDIYAQIDTLEKSDSVQHAFLIKTALYPWLICLALLCLGIISITNIQRNGLRHEYT